MSRASNTTAFQDNKAAFDEIIGDPFAVPDAITGHYTALKNRSSIAATKNNFDEGSATTNPARPNPIDFFCDVELIVVMILKEDDLVAKFEDTYIFESTEDAFTVQERADLEQRLGRAFRKHGISPVSRYFTIIKQKRLTA